MWSRYVWSQKCTQFKAAAATFGQRLLLLDTLHMCHGQFQTNVTGLIFSSHGFNSFTCRNGVTDKFRWKKNHFARFNSSNFENKVISV